MENIGNNVALLLNGKDIDESQDLCDFTLMDQNDNAGKSTPYLIEKNDYLNMLY